jgi:hypothetical protein
MFVQNLRAIFSQQVERGIALLEEKTLRVGKSYRSLFFLGAGYGMFRTAYARHEISVHFQNYVERLTRVFRLLIAAQAPSLKALMASEAVEDSAVPNKEAHEVCCRLEPRYLRVRN